MTRTDIILAIKKVKTAIERSKLKEVIDSALESGHSQGRSNTNTNLLEALHNFANEATNFGDPENELLDNFGLSILKRPREWIEWLSDEALMSDSFRNVIRGLNQITLYLPNLISLLQKDHEKFTASEREVREAETLTAVLTEDQSQFSTPARLIELLESISLLYETIADVNGYPDAKILVIGCDSGSDKSFDFLGVAQLVQQLKELLLAMWDHVIFYREKQVEVRIELIAKSLPILERISELESTSAMTPEKAEILRRNVHSGVAKFLDVGASIPEMSKNSSFNPKLLLHPKPKLLMPPPRKQTATPIENSDSEKSTSLTEDEQQTLKELLCKMNAQK